MLASVNRTPKAFASSTITLMFASPLDPGGPYALSGKELRRAFAARSDGGSSGPRSSSASCARRRAIVWSASQKSGISIS